MRNNQTLSTLLKEFEDVWSKGSEHLLDQKHRAHFVQFSTLLEEIQTKFPQFREQVENCDAQIFLSIPALAILHNLAEIVERFAPSL